MTSIAAPRFDPRRPEGGSGTRKNSPFTSGATGAGEVRDRLRGGQVNLGGVLRRGGGSAGATFPSGGDTGGQSGTGGGLRVQPQTPGDRVGRRQVDPSVGSDFQISGGGRGFERFQGGMANIGRTFGGEGGGREGMMRNFGPDNMPPGMEDLFGEGGFPGGEGGRGGGQFGGMFERIFGGGRGGQKDRSGLPGFRPTDGTGGPGQQAPGPVDDPSTPEIEGPSPTTATDELRRLNVALDAPGRNELTEQGGPAPVPGQPGPTGDPAQPADPAEGSVGLENLGAVVERRLGNETGGFGSEEALRFREIAANRRADERTQGVSDINADAARRGTSFSTLPSGELGGLEERIQRSADETDLSLQNMIAQASFGGKNRAIDDAFRFNQSAFSNEQARNAGLGNLGGLAGQLGQQGAPDLNQAVAGFGLNTQGSGGGIDPNLAATLGQLF